MEKCMICGEDEHDVKCDKCDATIPACMKEDCPYCEELLFEARMQEQDLRQMTDAEAEDLACLQSGFWGD